MGGTPDWINFNYLSVCCVLPVCPGYWTEIQGDQCSWKFMFLVFRFFLQMRPYFPTEVEGNGVSNMQDTGDKTNLYRLKFLKMSHNCPISFSKWPQKSHICPIFSPRQSHISHIIFKMLSGQPAIKKSMLHAIIRYMQQKIEAPPPLKSSILYVPGPP